ncbi:MAG: ABC transporter ATP-binding protein [Patulibacter sp.]
MHDPPPAEHPTGVTPAVHVDGLLKRYGEVEAVRGISFSVPPGEVFGLLGHNGAGKTTTIRMLTGRTPPTGGTASVGGHDIVTAREQARSVLNLVFEDQNLYGRLTGRDNLKLFGDLYGAPADRTDELLERVGIADAAKRKVKTYSTGMKQRLLLARGLINDPQVLFLDEPTRGLDPVSARNLRGIVRELRDGGTTVVLTTHDMVEADELCDRVAFLSDGEIIALDTPRELKLRVEDGDRGPAHPHRRHARVLLADRSERTVALDDPEQAAELNRWISDGQILTVHSDEPSLADVFVALAGRSLDEDHQDETEAGR